MGIFKNVIAYDIFLDPDGESIKISNALAFSLSVIMLILGLYFSSV